MEKSQYDLCIEVLRRFQKNGMLSHMVLIGSWCLPFYKEYFKSTDFTISLRTRDIDLLIPSPSRIRKHIDAIALLKDLGFVEDHSYPEGYMRLQHPELIIEFLVPEKGKGADKPYPLPQLGVNVQMLRYLDMLAQGTIAVTIENIPVTLPHPANFALHKLIVSQKRKGEEKMQKDIDAAVYILEALIAIGESRKIRDIYDQLHAKWKKAIISVLKSQEQKHISSILL